MPSARNQVGTSKEHRRGNGAKGFDHFVPLPKMFQMGIAKGKQDELERIIKLIEAERDAWTRQPAFNYKNALTDLIEKIK